MKSSQFVFFICPKRNTEPKSGIFFFSTHKIQVFMDGYGHTNIRESKKSPNSRHSFASILGRRIFLLNLKHTSWRTFILWIFDPSWPIIPFSKCWGLVRSCHPISGTTLTHECIDTSFSIDTYNYHFYYTYSRWTISPQVVQPHWKKSSSIFNFTFQPKPNKKLGKSSSWTWFLEGFDLWPSDAAGGLDGFDPWIHGLGWPKWLRKSWPSFGEDSRIPPTVGCQKKWLSLV